jgi:hypothetical protein
MTAKKVPFTTFFLLLCVLVLSSTSVLAQLRSPTPQRRTPAPQSAPAKASPQSAPAKGGSILTDVFGTREERQARRRAGVILAPTGPRCKRKK